MTLMMLVGFGFARFHREALFAGRVSSILHPMLRNLLPYFVVVAGFAVAWGQIPWASLFLVSNLGIGDPAQHSMLPFDYWFIEAYGQLCLITALAFSSARLRRGVAEHPFAIAFAAMIVAFGARYGVPMVYDIGLRKIFLLSYVLWLPLLGWAGLARGEAAHGHGGHAQRGHQHQRRPVHRRRHRHRRDHPDLHLFRAAPPSHHS